MKGRDLGISSGHFLKLMMMMMVMNMVIGDDDDGPGDDVFIKFTNHKFHTFSCSTDIKYSSVSTLLTQHLKPLP